MFGLDPTSFLDERSFKDCEGKALPWFPWFLHAMDSKSGECSDDYEGEGGTRTAALLRGILHPQGPGFLDMQASWEKVVAQNMMAFFWDPPRQGLAFILSGLMSQVVRFLLVPDRFWIRRSLTLPFQPLWPRHARTQVCQRLHHPLLGAHFSLHLF